MARYKRSHNTKLRTVRTRYKSRAKLKRLAKKQKQTARHRGLFAREFAKSLKKRFSLFM